MLKIGEFSKLSLTTVKALRFYEKKGLLVPASVDEWNGYLSGEDAGRILSAKAESLKKLKADTELQLSVIEFILEGKEMKYQVTVKEIPEMIVYSSETVLEKNTTSRYRSQ